MIFKAPLIPDKIPGKLPEIIEPKLPDKIAPKPPRIQPTTMKAISMIYNRNSNEFN